MGPEPDRSLFLRIAELATKAQHPDGSVRTVEFLAACSEVLPVIEKLGTAFALVRSDINGNITRLEKRRQEDPERYAALFKIPLEEVATGDDKDAYSATKGLLWLKRAMEFITALLQRLHDDLNVSLPAAASETYTATLYRYHGWVTSAAFTVTLKLAPSRETFFAKFDLPPGADLLEQVQQCLSVFRPLLAVVHQFLVDNNLDDPTKV